MNLIPSLRARSRSKTAIAGVAAVAALAVALTACSSSSDDSDSSGSSGSSGGAINVMAISIFQSSALSLPDAEAGFKAAVDSVNDAGGVNGRKINLIVCNDKFDPNTAADCARQAVSKKVVAVLESYEPFSTQVDPILEAAKIPAVYSGVAADVDTTSSISFPRDSGIQGLYGTLGIELADAGCKKIGAVVTSLANTELGADWLKKGAQSKGVSVVTADVGQTQADFNSPVAKLLSQDVDCLVPATAPDQGPKIVTAVQQSGKKVKIGAVTSEFGSAALAALGSAADGMILTGMEYRPEDTAVPAVQEVVAGLKKYQASVPLTTKFAIGAWASVTAFKQLAESIDGDITASSVLDAVKTFSPKTGLYADFSYGDKAPDPDLPQVKNWGYLTWTVTGGKSKLNSQEFKQPTSLFTS